MFSNGGVGEDPWESLGLQRDKITQSKGNQPWIFIGRTDTEAEIPVFWSPDVKSWLFGKDLDAGKDWSQKEKRRGKHGYIASLTQWTWIWANFQKEWGTEEPGMLQSIGLQSETQLSDWTTATTRSNLLQTCEWPGKHSFSKKVYFSISRRVWFLGRGYLWMQPVIVFVGIL